MAPVDRRDAWLGLATRHLQMARVLLGDFPDGAYFHVYHAFECALTAELLRLAPAAAVPSGHRDKIDAFLAVTTNMALSNRVQTLWPRLDRRNEAALRGLERWATADAGEAVQTSAR